MKMKVFTAAIVLYLCLGKLFFDLDSFDFQLMNFIFPFILHIKLCATVCLPTLNAFRWFNFGNGWTDVGEARRHPKIVTSIQNGGPNVGQKKDYEYNEYEYPAANSHQVAEDSIEVEGRHEHEIERHPHYPHHTEHEHHIEHHEHIHLHKPHSHSKKPGYSAGSGLRSIAQGSADQASSAVNNQVCMRSVSCIWLCHNLYALNICWLKMMKLIWIVVKI